MWTRHPARVGLLLFVVLSAALVDRPALGTVGLAEWEIATPGGHRISHVDPYKARFGTCLRRAGETADVYVERLEWWTFHPDHVVGNAARGYFIFDERTGQVDYDASEATLSAEIGARHLGAPTSKRLTPQDGWREAWMPVYRQACDRMKAESGPPAGVDQATYQRMKEICASFGAP